MKIEEITEKVEISDQIDVLKRGRLNSLPNITEILKNLEIDKHPVMDKSIRPDKQITQSDGTKSIVKVNRIPIPFQKRIVQSSASFAFGIPVEWSTPEASDYFKAYQKALDYAKYQSLDVNMCLTLKTFTESAEFWYTTESDDNIDYVSFKSKNKIRSTVFSPKTSNLYPFFDDFGDMIAFSREFVKKDSEDKPFTYFDVYTQTMIYNFRSGGEGDTFILLKEKKNTLNKIPIVYINQDLPEWDEVEKIIERLSYLLSNFSDCNDYHGSPTLMAKGEIKGFADKGEQGKLIQVGDGADLKYVTWEQAPDSIKLEIDTLFKVIYTFTHTPDISFESVKGIGNLSGVSLKLLFTDSHLKVILDKSLIYNSWFERRASIVKAMLGVLDNNNKEKYTSLETVFEIRPFMIDDLTERINELSTAVGGKPIISINTAVSRLGFVTDVESEIKRIIQDDSENIPFQI